MPRKKNIVNPATEPALVPQPEIIEPQLPRRPEASSASELPARSVPSLVEYEFAGLKWRCGRYDALSAEMNEIIPLPEWHGIIHELERPWLIFRRLFGIMPVIPPTDYPEDDMRSWGKDELCGALGVTRPQLQQELDNVRGMWLARKAPLEPALVEKSVVPPAPAGELDLDAEGRLLERYGFPTNFPNRGMRGRFAGRVKDLEKLLEEKTTHGMARNILMTELQIDRVDVELADFERLNKPGGKEYQSLVNLRNSLDTRYQAQWKEVRELAPWFTVVSGKHNFAGTISDITRAMQAYYASGDTTLADGIFTMTEILVECRRSVQAPEPRYRASLRVYWNMARQFLFDPNWQNRLPRNSNGDLDPSVRVQFKKLDAAWTAAFLLEEEKAGVEIPDLENDGEYEGLPVPEQAPKITGMPSMQLKVEA